MGQTNCISCNQPKFHNISDLTEPQVERVYDSSGNVIDEVMPGLENILGIINKDQYEHVNSSWRIIDVNLRNTKLGDREDVIVTI